jgi:nucleotide-binding universal stress UspA family protein
MDQPDACRQTKKDRDMGKINAIMVACDFSEYAPQVLEFGLNLATQLTSEVLVVNVINQRDVDAVRKVEVEYPAFSLQKYLSEQKQDRLSQMDALIAEVGGDPTTVRKMIRIGVPFKALVQAIEETGPDLLVMGTRGRGNLAGVLFGSTAEKVFRRCPIPVVSVRTEKPTE